MAAHDLAQIDQSVSLPDRLTRLNEELTSENKRFDRLNVLVGTHTFRILAERVDKVRRRWPRDDEYRASCRFDGREIWAYGIMPSRALQRLIEKLEWAVAKYDFEHEVQDIRSMQIGTALREPQPESPITGEPREESGTQLVG
jgi:hypothetical protein